MQGEYHCHKHDNDDEFFFVLDGHFIIDLEGRSVDLRPREGFVVPKEVIHRTRAPERAVILMVATAAIIPTGANKCFINSPSYDDIWNFNKFVFIAGFSGVSSVTRLEVGDYRSVTEPRALMTNLMREVEALARASGVDLDRDVVDQAFAVIDGAAPSMKTSMQRDVEAGRPSELESKIGVITVGR